MRLREDNTSTASAKGASLSIELDIAEHGVPQDGRFSALLSVDPDFAVVGDMHNGQHLAQAASDFQSDGVLMDLQSAGANGLEASTQVKRRHPDIRIVLLMSLRTEEQVRRALRARADGCLLRDASADELKASLRAVASGRRCLTRTPQRSSSTAECGRTTAARAILGWMR